MVLQHPGAQTGKTSARAAGSAAPPQQQIGQGGEEEEEEQGFSRRMGSHRSMSLSSQGLWRAELVLSLLCGQMVPPGLAGDAGQGLRLCGHLGPGWPFWGREGLSCTYLEAQQHCLWLPPSPPASSPRLSCPRRAALALACSAQACLDPTQRHQAGSSPPLAPVGRGCKRGGGCESIAQPRGENKAAWGPWLHVCAPPPPRVRGAQRSRGGTRSLCSAARAHTARVPRG